MKEWVEYFVGSLLEALLRWLGYLIVVKVIYPLSRLVFFSACANPFMFNEHLRKFKIDKYFLFHEGSLALGFWVTILIVVKCSIFLFFGIETARSWDELVLFVPISACLLCFLYVEKLAKDKSVRD